MSRSPSLSNFLLFQLLANFHRGWRIGLRAYIDVLDSEGDQGLTPKERE